MIRRSLALTLLSAFFAAEAPASIEPFESANSSSPPASMQPADISGKMATESQRIEMEARKNLGRELL